MMNVENLEIKEMVIPNKEDLLSLYNDAGWSNYTSHPDMLKQAYERSLYILTAWDKDQLVGTIRIVGDGISIIYIQDLIVRTNYQHSGIGTQLFHQAVSHYPDVYQKVLLTDDQPKTKAFYNKQGFHPSSDYECVSYVNFNM
ncbi:acetyltransferase, GNAT family [Lachnospiraceae bacterium KM106-2]|nr:acetyltransferase, GNAT family [Lachnospiraceae bacterium KM106-2]